MREYGEEKAKRELEELLQIIPIKIKNQDFINDVNENIKNQEYRMALEKVRRFLDEKEAEQVEIKPTEIEELDPDKIITETKKEAEESLYPEKLRNYALEKDFIGMLLNDPKLMAKYYILNDECYFDNKIFLEIYKGIVFTEGEAYTPYIAKSGYNFGKNNYEINHTKECLKYEYEYKCEKLNMEKIYVEIKKLFILRKNYTSMPIKSIQNGIVKITEYKLYDQMSEEEVKSAVNQVMVTDKFKQSVLSEELTDFFVQGNNNLTNGLEFPFRIISSVFKGIRRGETMAFAMPSNAGKSRFTINIAAYVAFIHKKKVLVISNEMSEEKMRLCLITTMINNKAIQEMHGQKGLKITEGELLEFKFRPDNSKSTDVDEDGYITRYDGEKQGDFVKRLLKESSDFKRTVAVTEWANKEIGNSIYFINITDHTNDELKKVIMNYYYKEQIEYVFYDTLKTDIANIGNGEEVKKTATILSNLAQNFDMYICSTLQLAESNTLPVNLNVNDLSASRTVKEVLDTLSLMKQINRDTLQNYEYSLEEVDTKFYDLKKEKDPDVRYYACVIDKNRAGAKPTLVFKINLAYNIWEELGYLRLKQGNEEN